MTPEMQPVDPPSSVPSRRLNRVTLTFAVIGLLAVLAGSTIVLKSLGLIGWSIVDLFTESDEAPIRVRGGSLDFIIVGLQDWEQVGASGNWRIANAERHREEFEVTVAVKAGATCGGSLTATGQEVVLVYENDNNEATTNTARIVMQSTGRRTLVRPDPGITMTWNAGTASLLRYQATEGYLKSIAVGSGANPAVICSFTSPAQLDHVVILNVP